MSGRKNRSVSTRSPLKPVSTCCSRLKLRISRPAPARSTTAAAISTATSAGRSRLASDAVDPRTLNEVWRSGRDVVNAGARPDSKPVAMAATSVKSNTDPSMTISFVRGSVVIASSGPSDAAARASPATPPQRERTTPSVSSWRTRRERLAPSAARTVSS